MRSRSKPAGTGSACCGDASLSGWDAAWLISGHPPPGPSVARRIGCACATSGACNCARLIWLRGNSLQKESRIRRADDSRSAARLAAAGALGGSLVGRAGSRASSELASVASAGNACGRNRSLGQAVAASTAAAAAAAAATKR